MRSYELRLSPCFLLLVGLQKKTTESFKIRTTGASKLKSPKPGCLGQSGMRIMNWHHSATPAKSCALPSNISTTADVSLACQNTTSNGTSHIYCSRKNFIRALSLSSKVIFGSVASIPSCCGWFNFPELKKLVLALHYMRHILGANINLRGDPTHELEQQLWGYSLIWEPPSLLFVISQFSLIHSQF